MKCFMTNQECICEADIRHYREGKTKGNDTKLRLFVVSPFTYPYEDIFHDAIMQLQGENGEGHYEVRRADKAVQLGFVMCQKICREIQEADYVLADVTEDNPNVYYELGLAFGFCKKVVFLHGESIRPNASAVWIRFLEERGVKMLTYADLRPLYQKVNSPLREPGGLEAYALDSARYVSALRGQNPYMCALPPATKKQALFCLSSPLPDRRLWLDATEEVLQEKGWQLHSLEIDEGIQVTGLLNTLKPCKVCLVDVSRYDGFPNPHAYWVLGVAHALGRDAIPVTNRTKTSGHDPFDVRGLWQVYFENLRGYKKSLESILEFVDRLYDAEIKEYPSKDVWNTILTDHPELEVFTFGRGSPADPTRDGGRTNVDKWDYQAVAKLSFFLAQNYRQASVAISPPADKPPGATKNTRKTRIEEVKAAFVAGKSYIVVGSPDVSDYAEVVLATAYGVMPYAAIACSRVSCLGSECHNACIGRSGYIFYKLMFFTESKDKKKEHPRATSFCYREANDKNEQCVLWYGKRYSCTSAVTYGVISILKNPFRNQDLGASTVVVLSGFTGVATYALAVLLSGNQEEYEGEGEQKIAPINRLQSLLAIYHEEASVQVLVKARIRSTGTAYDRDVRDLDSIEIEDVQPLRPCNTESVVTAPRKVVIRQKKKTVKKKSS